MISRFEHLPNELIFLIFSNISWSDILLSFWSLNKRFDELICSFLSKVNDKENPGFVFIEAGLSFEKCQKILFPLIFQSSSLLSSIHRLHFDGTNSNSFDLINELLFDNNERKSFHFSNLKSLILTRCLLSKSLINTLLFLIKYQLNELTLILDKEVTYFLRNQNNFSTMELEKGKLNISTKSK